MRSTTNVLLVLAFLSGELVGAGPRDAIAEATKKKSQGDKVGAEKVLREALVRWPRHPEVAGHLAVLLFHSRRHEESRDLFKDACEVAHDEPSCAAMLAIDVAAGRWREAEEGTRQFLSCHCRNSNRIYLLHLMHDQPAAAIEAGRRLIRIEPDEETSYLFLSAALWREGKAREALEVVEAGRKSARAVILLKDNPAWLTLNREGKGNGRK